jgi:hypothetical protein
VTEPNAFQARKEAVQSGQRPQMLGRTSEDIKEGVASVREQADLFKVYVKEWVIVATSQAHGSEGRNELEARFETKYSGRVYPDDVRYTSAKSNPATDESTVPVYLELHIWNVRGEFKHFQSAVDYVSQEVPEPLEVKIVGRNSRAEYDLKDYSTKRLLSSKLTGAKR